MGKKILFALFFLAFFCHKISASHIVGGEFQVTYTGKGNLYAVYMNMYYDDINAEQGLLSNDLTINILVFSKATNNDVRSFQLKRISTDYITYTTNGCTQSNGQTVLRTRLLRYQGTVDMTGLTEATGYYIAWERCCRNYQTLNIIHQNSSGTYISGQVFYLELPGVQIRNSSPVFSVAPAQYLCLNNFISIDFSATDPDGDSLVYSMTTPLQGHTYLSNDYLTGDPTYPGPAPYPLITFKSGYSATNAIHGNPALAINSNTGMLTVNPNEIGLYAFAIRCEEYRNGVKIGEVRRDFQYLIQNCPVASYPPSVGINSGNNSNQNPGSADWGSTAQDTIKIKLNKDTCYTIFVTDSNIFHPGAAPERVSISYGKTNLPKSVLSFSPSSVLISATTDTTTMKMCFSACDNLLIERDSTYFLDIIVTNGSQCPIKRDTLRTYVHVDVDQGNHPPTIGTTLAPSNRLATYPDTLTQFYVYGLDLDSFDIRTIDAKGFRFRMEDFRMNFTPVYTGRDSVAYLFNWIPNCDDLNNKTNYRIDFTLKDKSCIPSHNATTSITLTLQDVDSGLEYINPPNLVTPNGDNMNECFYIPNIPPDNCTYIFRNVHIYNRWGANVYTSSDRHFHWCAENVTDGVYFYYIDLTAKKIKGWVEVIR
ncbi:MAG TPA: gliding motility-associated C-terminal domain-containing protein [Cytophagaceae bacterium]|nr:gliding motility-associated C-terminal domain-containing protein [Cytophagaceae bacterium]